MAGNSFELVIGTKNWSSWSLRPWLLMRHAGIPFTETNIRLREPDTKENILRHSPSGFIPALKWQDRVIYDSLAICETIADLFPEKNLWPSDPITRAIARSAAAEMHSGFQDVRREMPMVVLERHPGEGQTPEALAAARRILSLWNELRQDFGQHAKDDEGFLFGHFTVADAMYAPVVTRFITYDLNLSSLGDDGTAKAYMETIYSMPAMQKWIEEAAAEKA